jgi:fructose-1,6-bisphosphatase/inositol monophosphatase family enzyme
MNYLKELELLKTHVPRIYREIDSSLKEVSFKSGDEIVTTTDLYIESELIKVIKTHFPTDTFLTPQSRSLLPL